MNEKEPQSDSPRRLVVPKLRRRVALPVRSECKCICHGPLGRSGMASHLGACCVPDPDWPSSDG